MKRTDYGYADLTKSEVYDFRKALNLSQAKLSKKLGLSLTLWSCVCIVTLGELNG